MNKQVEFYYGVLYPSLEEQANKQGFTLEKNAEFLERLREAVNLCGFYVATDSQVNLMLKKLQKKVVKNLVLLKK